MLALLTNADNSQARDLNSYASFRGPANAAVDIGFSSHKLLSAHVSLPASMSNGAISNTIQHELRRVFPPVHQVTGVYDADS